jgi:hypothetical protein
MTSITADTLRIVCTKCLKLAHVLRVEANMGEDALEVWVECHDKSIMGYIDSQIVLQGGRDVTMQDLRRVRGLDAMLNHALEAMRKFAARADVLTQYIGDAKSQHEDECLQRYEAAGAALIKAYEDNRGKART